MDGCAHLGSRPRNPLSDMTGAASNLIQGALYPTLVLEGIRLQKNQKITKKIIPSLPARAFLEPTEMWRAGWRPGEGFCRYPVELLGWWCSQVVWWPEKREPELPGGGLPILASAKTAVQWSLLVAVCRSLACMSLVDKRTGGGLSRNGAKTCWLRSCTQLCIQNLSQEG